MSCGIGHRSGLDPALLWLWRRPAATAPLGLLAWKASCATGEALKDKKKKESGSSVQQILFTPLKERGPPWGRD